MGHTSSSNNYLSPEHYSSPQHYSGFEEATDYFRWSTPVARLPLDRIRCFPESVVVFEATSCAPPLTIPARLLRPWRAGATSLGYKRFCLVGRTMDFAVITLRQSQARVRQGASLSIPERTPHPWERRHPAGSSQQGHTPRRGGAIGVTGQTLQRTKHYNGPNTTTDQTLQRTKHYNGFVEATDYSRC